MGALAEVNKLGIWVALHMWSAARPWMLPLRAAGAPVLALVMATLVLLPVGFLLAALASSCGGDGSGCSDNSVPSSAAAPTRCQHARQLDGGGARLH